MAEIMSKGYWIVRVDITEPEAFKAYVASNSTALKIFGAKYLARAGTFTTVEGTTRSRNTIVEFPSYQHALDCWHSAEYQEARALRSNAAEIDIVIVEGYEGPQLS
jgi:uncharacterized protein (DUF1330 family)